MYTVQYYPYLQYVQYERVEETGTMEYHDDGSAETEPKRYDRKQAIAMYGRIAIAIAIAITK